MPVNKSLLDKYGLQNVLGGQGGTSPAAKTHSKSAVDKYGLDKVLKPVDVPEVNAGEATNADSLKVKRSIPTGEATASPSVSKLKPTIYNDVQSEPSKTEPYFPDTKLETYKPSFGEKVKSTLYSFAGGVEKSLLIPEIAAWAERRDAQRGLRGANPNATAADFNKTTEKLSENASPFTRQIAEGTGQVVPMLLTGGPVSGAIEGGVAKVLGKGAATKAGKLLITALGSGGMMSAFKGAEMAGKAALDPNYRPSVKEVGKELGRELAVGAGFGVAGKLVGEPIAKGISKVLPTEAGGIKGALSRGASNLVRGTAVGTAVTVPQTGVGIASQAAQGKPIDWKQEGKNAATGIAQIAALDVLMGGQSKGLPRGEEAKTYSVEPDVIQQVRDAISAQPKRFAMDALAKFTPQEQAELLTQLPAEEAAKVMPYLPQEQWKPLIDALMGKAEAEAKTYSNEKVTEPAPTAETKSNPPQSEVPLDRMALIRDANPGMDDNAISDIVKTTANLSDEDFKAFALRVGKSDVTEAPAVSPEAIQPSTPNQSQPAEKPVSEPVLNQQTPPTFRVGQPVRVVISGTERAGEVAGMTEGGNVIVNVGFARDVFRPDEVKTVGEAAQAKTNQAESGRRKADRAAELETDRAEFVKRDQEMAKYLEGVIREEAPGYRDASSLAESIVTNVQVWGKIDPKSIAKMLYEYAPSISNTERTNIRDAVESAKLTEYLTGVIRFNAKWGYDQPRGAAELVKNTSTVLETQPQTAGIGKDTPITSEVEKPIGTTSKLAGSGQSNDVVSDVEKNGFTGEPVVLPKKETLPQREKVFGETVKVGDTVKVANRTPEYEVVDTKDKSMVTVREKGKPDAPTINVGRKAVKPTETISTAKIVDTQTTSPDNANANSGEGVAKVNGQAEAKTNSTAETAAAVGTPAKEFIKDVPVSEEGRYYGSEVTVEGQFKGDTSWKGILHLVYNRGSLLVVHPISNVEDPGSTFRVSADKVTIDKLVDNKKTEQAKPVDAPEVREEKGAPYINAAELADTYKALGLDRHRAWDQYVKDTIMSHVVRTEAVDAKEFYKYYDELPRSATSVHPKYPRNQIEIGTTSQPNAEPPPTGGSSASMTRKQLEDAGYIPVFRGTGADGLKNIRPSEEGVLGPGVYFYDSANEAKTYSEPKGGIVTGYVRPEDVKSRKDPISGSTVYVLSDASKLIRRGVIPTEKTLDRKTLDAAANDALDHPYSEGGSSAEKVGTPQGLMSMLKDESTGAILPNRRTARMVDPLTAEIDKSISWNSEKSPLLEKVKSIPEYIGNVKEFMIDHLFDKKAAIGQYQREFGGKGELPVEQDAALRMELLPKMVPGHVEHVLTELKGVLSPVGDRIADYMRYADARVTLYRAQKFGYTYEANKLPMDLATARAFVDRINTSPEAKMFQDVFSAEQNMFSTRGLQTLVDAGVITQEAADAAIKDHQDYVPFYRDMEATVNAKGEEVKAGRDNPRAGMGRTVVDVPNPVKSQHGSARKLMDPMERRIRYYARIQSVALRAQVGRALRDFAMQYDKGGAQMQKVHPPVEKVRTKVEDIMTQLEDLGADPSDFTDPNAVIEFFRPKGAPRNSRVTSIFVDGKREYWDIKNKRLYDAVNSMDPITENFFAKFFQKAAEVYRTGATITPSFSIANLIRDTIDSFRLSKNQVVPGQALYEAVRLSVKKDPFIARVVQDGLKQGGWMSPERMTNDMMKAIVDPRGETLSLKQAWKLYLDSRETAEFATRLGEASLEYRKRIAQGQSDTQAYMHALREGGRITLNFTRSGKSAGQANRYVPFFKIPFEAAYREYEAATEHPMTYAVKTIIPAIAVAAATVALNRDNKDYMEASDFERDKYMLIPVGKGFIRVPKGNGVGGFILNMAERTLRQWALDDPEAFHDWSSTAVNDLFPRVSNPALELMVAGATGYSMSMERQIIPERLKKLGLSAPELQKDSHTSPTVEKAVSPVVGKVPVVGKYMKSPMLAQYVIESILPGYAEGYFMTEGFVRRSANAAKNGTTLERTAKSISFEELPAVGRFYSRPGEGKMGRSVDLLYEASAKAESAYEAVRTKLAEQSHQPVTMDKLTSMQRRILPSVVDSLTEDQRTYYDNKKAYDKAVDSLSKLNSQLRGIESDMAMDPAEKRSKIEDLRKQMTDMAAEAMSKVKK